MTDRPLPARDGRPVTGATSSKDDGSFGNSPVAAPTISLPKGGGAIRGMGEKFAANPVTGTGSMSVPIATSPGRVGFGPQLSLAYDSGAGNGPFGLGWNLSLPSITRKTDKGLPHYYDAEESDVFILSGAEDLVPMLTSNGERFEDKTTFPGFVVHRYRPRIEGLFARIERWTNTTTSEIHWRSITRDNITTLYGKDNHSRIFDPAEIDPAAPDSTHPTRIFSWLICQSYDDKGNAIVYQYVAEDDANVNLTQANERNRMRKANRYLKRIQYGNRAPNRDANGAASDPTLLPDATWMFQVVFDYGEGHLVAPPAQPGEHQFVTATLSLPNTAHWPARLDPFSSYRAGFEVRTYRLCRRVLLFHHFPAELSVADCLVRSTEFSYNEGAVASFITQVTQSGYVRQPAPAEPNRYLRKALPPIEFTYSQVPTAQELAARAVQEVDAASLENLPIGLDGALYQWVDLDGEGLSGLLTDQGDGWFYKRNTSANNLAPENGNQRPVARFAPLERVATRPAGGLRGGQAQFMDLAGDGQPDLVLMEGPVRGFYERTPDEAWEPFHPFRSWPNVDTRDPNLKFIDLNGDGHSDILITEHDAFTWHGSLAEDGFGPAQRTFQPWDEEQGPRLVFADGKQSIYLADLSGDGLTDLARIRNGEVCYWPNVGYGRFGAKVTMDHAPWFDHPDQFDQQRIRLADIDGSGVTDILYLSRQGVQIFYNQSGNGWSAGVTLENFPALDNLAAVQAVDLLGNGTACLVWSSPLPGDARRPMRYLDLMGEKPHLLVKTVNNLGAETHVQYAPSTKFYLADKAAGKPWITKLPFPVHVVERVTVTDKWRKTTFSSTYSYHHGYFDGNEREFRGFGRVEQLDSESYGEFASGNSTSPYITDDKTLYQPPVKTVTWYYTGAALDREHILSQFEHEYFPRWFEDLRPDEVNVLGDFQENVLPEPDLETEDLTAEEWREALRACKGMLLRQEVCELDVDALEHGEHRPVKLFSTAYHNCHIRRLQPQAGNRHAVFLVAESEAITYHYELDLTLDTVRPDPRIAHTLNLKLDEHANVLQSAAVVYPRLGQFDDSTLPADALALIRGVQQESHLAYTETRYTDDVDWADNDNYRLRVPCEVLTYELTGIFPEDADDLLTSEPRDNLYFTLAELRRFRLSLVHQTVGEAVPEIAYHQLPKRTTPEKRLVEHARMLFFKDDLADPEALKEPLALGHLGRLGLSYETYKLALTEELLNAVFSDTTGNKLDRSVQGARTARQLLGDAGVSGYLSGADLVARFAPLPAAELAGQYWIRSGIAGFADDAAQHFYLPERYTDPFGNLTRLEYDGQYDLFIQSSTDALANTTRVTQFDYRVLALRAMQDINDNLSEVFFDMLGLPAATAVMGKGTEGDNLDGFNDALANPTSPDLAAFFNQPDLDETQAHTWLGNATARHLYYFGETLNADGSITWAEHPPCACGLMREQHVSQLAPGEQSSLQAAFEYSDGMGSVLVKKVQAEPEQPGGPLRWVAGGKTILNNKGKPVKQYEPYFSQPEVGHRFDAEEAGHEEGVTPIIYYDAVGRTVRTELPDGSFSRVEFSPWHVTTYDPNDTAFDPDPAQRSDWYNRRMDPAHPRFDDFNTPQNMRVATLVEAHANTPAITGLDSLGCEVIAIAHNRAGPANALVDEKTITFTKLDAEGKPLWVQDARRNRVMQYIMPPLPEGEHPFDDPSNLNPQGFAPCYDIAGNLLFQHSMDAGDRWMLNDAAGKPMFAWNSRGFITHVECDALHRPTGSFVTATGISTLAGGPRNPLLPPDPPVQFEKLLYGEGQLDDTTRNLRGKPYQHCDTAGVVTMAEGYDFKGNPHSSQRQLVADYKMIPDWSQTPLLEHETFTSRTRYDALNRPIQVVAPHSDQPTAKFNVIRPGYNEAGLLERMDVWLNQSAEPADLLNPTSANLHAVTNIDYDAKGQRIRIVYNEAGHPIITEYSYDKETFRLTHLLTTRPNHPEADKRTLQDLAYTYDPVGNITHIGDQAQPRVFFDNDCIEASNDYRYDALYRLVAATGREHKGQDLQPGWDDSPRMDNPIPYNCSELRHYVESYRYDPVGNILQMIHHLGSDLDAPGGVVWNRRYQYRPDNDQLRCTSSPGEAQLPEYSDAPTQYAQRYTYDAHGNMTTMPHLPLMQWNDKDQLQATATQVVNNGGTAETTYYVYDAAGQRVRKVTERQAVPGDTPIRMKERIYLGGFELYREYNGNGNTVTLERETLHVMDDKQRLALVETRTDTPALEQLIRYQFGNHLGSASLELDEQAQIISYEEYTPYGSTSYQAVRSQTETPKRYRYTGKERDEETGLYYHGARYYAPWLGRWTASDPIGLGDGSNVYAYVRGSPVILHDPDGTENKPVTKVDRSIMQMTDPQLHSHLKQLSPVERDKFARSATGAFAGRASAMLDKYGMERVRTGVTVIERPETAASSNDVTAADASAATPNKKNEEGWKVTGVYGFIGLLGHHHAVESELLGLGGYDTHEGAYFATLTGGGLVGTMVAEERIRFSSGKEETEHLLLIEDQIAKVRGIEMGVGGFLNLDDPSRVGVFAYGAADDFTFGGGVEFHMAKDFDQQMQEDLAKHGIKFVRDPEVAPKPPPRSKLVAMTESWAKFIGIDLNKWAERQLDEQNKVLAESGSDVRIVHTK